GESSIAPAGGLVPSRSPLPIGKPCGRDLGAAHGLGIGSCWFSSWRGPRAACYKPACHNVRWVEMGLGRPNLAAMVRSGAAAACPVVINTWYGIPIDPGVCSSYHFRYFGWAGKTP